MLLWLCFVAFPGCLTVPVNAWKPPYHKASLDFIAKLAALVPTFRVNLTRFQGVFAPNSKHQVQVTPAGRGKGNETKSLDGSQDQSLFE